MSVPVCACLWLPAVTIAPTRHTAVDLRGSLFPHQVINVGVDIQRRADRFVSEGRGERLDVHAALGFDFESIVDVLKAVWEGFCELLAPIFEGAFQAVAGVLDGVLTILLGVLDVFIGLFTGNWEQLWNGLCEIVQGFADGWAGIIEGAVTIVTGILDTFCGWFGTSGEAVWSSVSDFFQNTWNSIASFFGSVWTGISSTEQAMNINYGGVTINVYGREGQDIRALADGIEERLTFAADRRRAAFA